jgi:hypothetical protein
MRSRYKEKRLRDDVAGIGRNCRISDAHRIPTGAARRSLGPNASMPITDDSQKSERLLRGYLSRRKLEIGAIVLMAHDIPPWRWPYAGPESAKKVHPHYQALRAAASEGQLGATLSYSEKLDHKAQISLPDLRAFLKQAGPEWDWLRPFATRWHRYSGKPEVRRKSAKDPEEEVRDHIALVLTLGRELQNSEPTINRSEIIDRIAKSNRSKFSRETIRKIVYGTYPKMKLLNLSGLAKKT